MWQQVYGSAVSLMAGSVIMNQLTLAGDPWSDDWTVPRMALRWLHPTRGGLCICNDDGNSCDFCTYRELMEPMERSVTGRVAILRTGRLFDLTREFLSEPLVWAAVERLAVELQERRTLGHDEITEATAPAMGLRRRWFNRLYR